MSTYEPLASPTFRRATRPALSDGSLALAVGLLVGLDQAAKVWVEHNLPPRAALPLWGDVVGLVHYANRGAAGGLGEGLPWLVPALTASGAVLIVVLLAAYRLYRRHIGVSWRGQAFLVFATAPLLCTLIDRLRLGYVLDFVHVAGWPIFNIGDLLPNFAVIFLLLEAVAVVKRSY
jgi:signal peptidase II